MRFRVMDNKTGKEANPYEIALYEEWAQRLVYCDMEGFAITENGDLMLADECGNSVYCDPERFKVVFEVESPHGEWLKSDIPESLLAKCSICGFDCGAYTHNFCPNCGFPMNEKALEILRKREGERND